MNQPCQMLVNSPYHQPSPYAYNSTYAPYYQNSPVQPPVPPPPPPVYHPEQFNSLYLRPPPGIKHNAMICYKCLFQGFHMKRNTNQSPEPPPPPSMQQRCEKPSYATNLFNIQSNNDYTSSHNQPQSSANTTAVMEVAGVFWDIENCAVPHQKSAFALVHRIREKMFRSMREVEFMCACDTTRENKVTESLRT